MEDSQKKKYNKRFEALKAEFVQNWEAHYKDIAEYLLTRKGRVLESDVTPNDGSKKNDSIIDGTGGRALRVLAAGMQGGLTSPARPWFRLGLSDKDLAQYGPVRVWLEEVRRRMMMVFGRSNFYNTIHSMYGELGGFGTAAMLIEEDYKHVIRCYPFTIGEYFIATDHQHRVNSFYRAYWMTAFNMLSAFGDGVSAKVKKCAEGAKGDEWFEVVHLIEPNDLRDPSQEDAPNKAWKSVYYEYKGQEEDKFLRVSGYNDFPVMAPRWDVTGSEVYGRSPGMDVLGDTKMLQKLQSESLKALDKVVNPPMVAPGALKGVKRTVIPGGVTYLDYQQGSGQKFEPAYQISPDIRSVEYKIERVQTAIREGFFNDLFLMLAGTSNKNMTATEVSERHEEKLLMIGPTIERLQPELLDRVIDRTYDIMDPLGLIPEAPPELQGMDLEVEYISLLAQAQKLVGVTSIEQTAAFVGNLTAVFPDAADKFDADEAIDHYAEMTGVPTKLIRSDEDVEAIRAQRAEQEQAMQQAEAAERAAQGAKVLSETDTGGNNALAALMQGMGGQPG